MKKILLISLLSLSAIFAAEDITVKGVTLDNYGIIVEKNSELEKDLISVLKKHNQIKSEAKSGPYVLTDEEKKSIPALNKISLNACISCHGVSFERKALNQSKIVKDLTKDEITLALNGYKNDTYGSNMKGIMKAQVSKYSSEEISQIAEAIKNLK